MATSNPYNVTSDETFDNQTYFDHVAALVAHALFVYYTPVLILLGSIGNLLSVYVFFNSKLRLQSTSQYLSALAISDTIFLLQLLAPWLSAVSVTSIFYTGGFCQVFVYLSYVSCCLSAWLVVAFTIERFVAVLYPLRRNAWCTVKRARHVIILLSGGATMMNLPVLRFAIPTSDDCNIDRKYLEHAARFNLVDTMLSFSIPLSLIVLLNVWIIFGVCRLERTRHQLMKAEGSTAGERARQTRLVGCPRSQQRVTRMLLIVSSVFVILNLPGYALRIIAYAYDLQGSETMTGRWMALQQLAIMFFHTNFGINFMLYCLTGQNFRRAVCQSLPCLRQRARRAVAVRRPTSRPARASSISTSFISNCTEATNLPSATAATPGSRRRRQEPFITRWKFDNSKQRRQIPGAAASAAVASTSAGPSNDVEMRVLNSGAI
ncbi:neuromedin-U receptor 1-like isoform X2 [Zerene cesonia]|uniref:neuromedin-U receptor 1-like isoform X2 n=1 Tax=Zerene cesonia TaxID=33412 RepID=UPI0018E562B7|nr:neuromedin-U receptor 1-like isoform X2 [Zerene cesonia]